MDNFIQFMTNGRSVFWDVYSLMRDPEEKSRVNKGIQDAIYTMSPFKKTSVKNNETLKKLENVINLTSYFSDHAAKGFLLFSVLNVLAYHFTRMLNFITLTYFVGAFFFTMLYLDATEISGGAQDLKGIFKENGKSPSISKKVMKQLGIEDPKKQQEFQQLMAAKVTHNNVRIAKKRIKRLIKHIYITRPITRIPLIQMMKHLEALETELNTTLHTKGCNLNFDKV